MRTFFIIFGIVSFLFGQLLLNAEDKTPSLKENDWGYVDTEEFFNRNEPTTLPPLAVEGGDPIEVGEILEGKKKIIQIALKNTSETERWKIQDIDASCSCTNIDGIPGGKYLDPGEIWKMDVRIDGGKISPGEFVREIRIMPLEYRSVVLHLHGTIRRYFRTIPENNAFNFGELKSPEQPWSAVIDIYGVDASKDILKLGDMPEHKDVLLTKEEISPGQWTITATPKRPLYYTSKYSAGFEIPVVEPANFPPIPIRLNGVVGMTLSFYPSALALPAEFLDENKPLELSTQLGFDPAEIVNDDIRTLAGKQRQKMQDAFMSKIDWKTLMEKMEIQCPPGVMAEKVWTRYGIRLDLKVLANAFAEDEVISVKTFAYDHELATFKLKKINQ